jgi:glycosyltransferase involved in cell wall biosynthesis
MDCASGQYISFLDSDDLYLPNRLEILDRYIRAAGKPPSLIFHRQNRCLASRDSGVASPSRLPTPGERLDNYILITGNFIQTNTFIVERELAKRIRFDASCTRHEDTKFVIECWLASPNYIACEEILSVYHDFCQSSRLSKQQGFELLLPLLRLAERRCTPESHDGFVAYVNAEMSFFDHPTRITSAIWRAYRAGVPKLRCAVYLARSILGTARVDQAIQLIRLALLRSGFLRHEQMRTMRL